MGTYNKNHNHLRTPVAGDTEFANTYIGTQKGNFIGYGNQIKDDNQQNYLDAYITQFAPTDGYFRVDEYPKLWEHYTDSKVTSLGTVYKVAGNKTLDEILALNLSDATLKGNVYNVSGLPSGQTTGTIPADKSPNNTAQTDVRIGDQILVNQDGKLDNLRGFIDLSSYQTKTISATNQITASGKTTVEDTLKWLYDTQRVLSGTGINVEKGNTTTYTSWIVNLQAATASTLGGVKAKSKPSTGSFSDVYVDSDGNLSVGYVEGNTDNTKIVVGNSSISKGSTTGVEFKGVGNSTVEIKSGAVEISSKMAVRVDGKDANTTIHPETLVIGGQNGVSVKYDGTANDLITIENSGVRSITQNGNTLTVNTGGSTKTITFTDTTYSDYSGTSTHGLVPPKTNDTASADYFLNEKGEWTKVESGGVKSVKGKNNLLPTTKSTGDVEIGVNWASGDGWRIPTSLSGSLNDNRSQTLWSSSLNSYHFVGLPFIADDKMYEVGKMCIEPKTQNFSGELLPHKVGTTYNPLPMSMSSYNTYKVYCPPIVGTVPDTGSNFFLQKPSSVVYDASPNNCIGWYDWSEMDTARYYLWERLLTFSETESVKGVPNAKHNQQTVIGISDYHDIPEQNSMQYVELNKTQQENLQGLAKNVYGFDVKENNQAVLKWFYDNNNHRMPEFSTHRNPDLYQVSLWNLCKNGGYVGYDCRESSVVNNTWVKIVNNDGKTEKQDTIAKRPLTGQYGKYQRAYNWSNLTNGILLFSKLQDQQKAELWPFEIVQLSNGSYGYAHKQSSFKGQWPKTVIDCVHGEYDTYMRPKFSSAQVYCELKESGSTSIENEWTLLVAISSSIPEMDISIGGHKGKLRFNNLYSFSRYTSNSKRKLKSDGNCTIEWYDDSVRQIYLDKYEFMVRISPNMWFNDSGQYTASDGDMEIFARIKKESNGANNSHEVSGNIQIPNGAKYITNYEDLLEIPSILNVDSNDVTPSPLKANATTLPSFPCNYYGFYNDNRTYDQFETGDVLPTKTNFYAFPDDTHKSYEHPGSKFRTNAKSGISENDYSDWVVNGNIRTRTGRYKEYDISWKTNGAFGENLYVVNCYWKNVTETQTEKYDTSKKTWGSRTSSKVETIYKADADGKVTVVTSGGSEWTKFSTDTTDFTIYPRGYAFNVGVIPYDGATGKVIDVQDDQKTSYLNSETKIATLPTFKLIAWNEDATQDTYMIFGKKLNS